MAATVAGSSATHPDDLSPPDAPGVHLRPGDLHRPLQASTCRRQTVRPAILMKRAGGVGPGDVKGDRNVPAVAQRASDGPLRGETTDFLGRDTGATSNREPYERGGPKCDDKPDGDPATPDRRFPKP